MLQRIFKLHAVLIIMIFMLVTIWPGTIALGYDNHEFNPNPSHNLIPLKSGPVLAISRVVDKDAAAPGGTLNYVYSIQNTGDTSATAVSLYNTLPSELVLRGVQADRGPMSSAWPMFRQNPQHTGRSVNYGPITNTVRCTYTIGSPIQSSPAIALDGTVYVGADDGKLYAFNPDCTLKWSYTKPTTDAIKSSPAIDVNGTIYIGTNDNYLYAINSNNTLKWRHQTGDVIQASPTIGGDGTIYVGSYDKSLYALTPANILKWKRTTGGQIKASVALALAGPNTITDDDTIYFSHFWLSNPNFYALTPDNNIKWSLFPGRDLWSSPSVDNAGVIYFAVSEAHIHKAINPNSTTKWVGDYGSDATLGSPAISINGSIYVGIYSGGGSAVRAINPEGIEIWRRGFLASVYSSPAIDGAGVIYVGTENGELHALNPANGADVWSYSVGTRIFSSPTIGPDGTIYFGSDNGIFYGVGPGTPGVPENPFVVSLGTILPNEIRQVTVTVSITETATPGATINNMVSASAANATTTNNTHVITVITPTCYARINNSVKDYYVIQSAIDAANTNDTVKVAGICQDITTKNGLKQIVYINKSITLQGGYTTTNWVTSNPSLNPTTLDAQGIDRVVYITGDITPTIKGVTITGGHTGVNGGGIYAQNAHPLIDTVIISGNTQSGCGTCGGGGIMFDNTDRAKIVNSIIQNNSAHPNGGGLLVGGHDIVLENLTIQGNQATADGGGINFKGFYTSTFRNSKIINNYAGDDGGGIYVDVADNYRMENNLIANNSISATSTSQGSGAIIRGTMSGVGGGLLFHNTFANNLGGNGQAIFFNGAFELKNSIIANHLKAIEVQAGAVTATNNIIWNNGSSPYNGNVISATNRTDCDPLFTNPIANDYHLKPTSCAIDYGTDLGITTDLEGNTRPIGPGFDAGAYELTCQAPQAIFTATPLSGPSPLSVQFANYSTGQYDVCLWNFGPFGTSNDCNLIGTSGKTYTFNETGTENTKSYDVTLNVSGTCSSSTVTHTVVVHNPCKASFTYTLAAGNPLTVLLGNTSEGSCNGSLWEFSDGRTSINTEPKAAPLPQTFALPTGLISKTYQITLTMYGPGQSTPPSSQQSGVTIYQKPTASFSTTIFSGLSPLVVTFTNATTGYYNKQVWDFGDGGIPFESSSDQKEVTYSFDKPGVYTVTLWVGGPGGSDIVTKSTYITITAAVRANFSLTPNTGILLPTLTVSVTNVYTPNVVQWRWDWGQPQPFTQALPPPIVYTSPGHFNITLTVTGTHGESATVVKQVMVYEKCQAKFTPSKITGQIPLTVDFHNDSSVEGCDKYSWVFGDGAIDPINSNPNHTYQTPGTYTVILTATDKLGGTSVYSQVITATIPKCEITTGDTFPYIEPPTPKDNDPLELKYLRQPCKLLRRVEDDQIRWYQNQHRVIALDNKEIVPALMTNKNDNWEVEVIPCKNTDKGTTCGNSYKSSSVSIGEQGNNLPQVYNLIISPTAPLETDALTLTYVFSDADGDQEYGTEIFWFTQKQQRTDLATNTLTILANDTFQGQVWCVKVRPKDSRGGVGTVATSNCVSIGSDTNHAPQIISPTLSQQRQIEQTELFLRYNQHEDISQGYYDADKDPQAQMDIQWYRITNPNNEGVHQPELDNKTVISKATIAGEFWYARIRVSDGKLYSPWVETSRVEIKAAYINSPPQVSNVHISPPSPTVNDLIKLEYTYNDVDGDEEGTSTIYWYKDTITQTAYTGWRTIPAGIANVGEEWYVRVIPVDRLGAEGDPIAADSVRITNNPIFNNPPTITQTRISPAFPSDTDVLTLSYEYMDIEDGILEGASQIQWTVKITDLAQVNSDFADKKFIPAIATKASEIWCAKVIPMDTQGKSGVEANVCVTIGASSTNHKPQALRVYISPNHGSSKTNLELHYTFYDPDCSEPCESGTEIFWYKDGHLQPDFNGLTVVSNTATLPGQVWTATVKPSDGQIFGDLVTTANATINYPPMVTTITHSPTLPNAGEAIAATCVYSDADRDPQSDLVIKWLSPTSTTYTSTVLPSGITQSDEQWWLTCQSHDGIEYGEVVTMPITITSNPGGIYLPLILKNRTPPTITPTPTGTLTPPTPTPTATFTPMPTPTFTLTPLPCSTIDTHEPNNNQEEACPTLSTVTALATVTISKTYVDDIEDYYSLTLRQTSRVGIKVEGYKAKHPGRLLVYDSFNRTQAIARIPFLEGDIQTLPNNQSPLALYSLPPGTYYIRVYTYEGDEIPKNEYKLTVGILPKRPASNED